MNTLAEHLLDPHLSAHTGALGPTFSLHVQHEVRTATVSAAVYYVKDGVPVVIVNGMLRPAQFKALNAEIDEFNQDPRTGWVALALATSKVLADEAMTLRKQADALMEQSQAVSAKWLDWV